jgi:hypothetical protein
MFQQVVLCCFSYVVQLLWAAAGVCERPRYHATSIRDSLRFCIYASPRAATNSLEVVSTSKQDGTPGLTSRQVQAIVVVGFARMFWWHRGYVATVGQTSRDTARYQNRFATLARRDCATSLTSLTDTMTMPYGIPAANVTGKLRYKVILPDAWWYDSQLGRYHLVISHRNPLFHRIQRR